MGLPLSAKSTGTDNATPSASKDGAKGTHATCAAPSLPVAQKNMRSDKKSKVAPTPDISKTAASPSLVSKQESASPISARLVRTETRAGTEPSALVTRNSSPVRTEATPARIAASGRLARMTAYWSGEGGDYYTGRCISATGVRLHDGHCAVDPRIIPYGSVVEIAGVGKFLADDTGYAVISRTAAREDGHTSAERSAIVVDLFFKDRDKGQRFAAAAAKYVSISWWTPTAVGLEAKAARRLFAEEDWDKIQGKQL